MLRWLVHTSLQFRHLVLLVALGLIIFGFLQLRGRPLDLLPEFGPPIVEIQTEALGLAPAEVEGLITAPLEEILAGVPWIKTVQSRSIANLSSIVLVFEPGTDLMNARQMVQERLLHASVLPKVSKPPTMLQPVSSLNRVVQIGLSSNTVSLIDMSVLARWKIKPRLMGVQGVAAVSIWGQRERQLQVQVDPEKLRAKGVVLDDVIKAAGDALWVSPLTFLRASTPGNGGFIDTPNQRFDIRHVLPIKTPEDLSRVTFLAGDGSPVRLGDVANVIEGHQPMIGDGIVDDRPGLVLVIEKFPGANTIEVTEGVEKALDALKPGLPGVSIDSTIFRPATFIEKSGANRTTMLVLAGALITLALVAFLGRVALISLVAIPLSLMAAGLVLQLFGAPINIMILAGLAIALGSVIDDAIIDVENIVRRVREDQREGSPKSIATIILEASLEIRRPIIYATLIIVLAVLPVFAVEGLSGAFFQPLALSYGVAVLASMVVALTITPALCLILLSNVPLNSRPAPLVPWLQGHYERLLARTIQAPRWTFITTGVVVVLGLAVLPFLGQSLLPEFKERDFVINWVTKPGTSYPEMNRIVAEATRKLRAVPGVRNVGAQVGRAVQSDTVATVNTARVWVSVAQEADYNKTLDAVRDALGSYPGTRSEPMSFATMRLRELLTGSSDPIVVRVFGPDLQGLRSKAEEVKEALSQIKGVVDPKVQARAEEPSIEIEVNLAAAERHGLKPGDVRRAASTLMAGIEVGNLFEEQKIFEVMVWSLPETRRDLESIRNFSVETPNGARVRLGEVAEVRLASSLAAVTRANASRYVDVSANVSGRDLKSVVGDVERRLKDIQFPREYHPELVGEYAERQAAQNRMFWFGIVMAIAILFLLQASLGSWRMASLAYLLLPSALIGGVFAAFATGGVISLGSLVGFLTVLGISVRNGILLISHYQHLEREQGEPFGPGLVVRGARERLSPILMTALITGLALVPLLVIGEVPGNEIEHPMAIVIIGGLATSILITLFVVPTVYSVYRSRAEPQNQATSIFASERRVQYAAE